ncbi:NUDIX hydrolase [Anaerolineales bacterium HSG6]|nr:NUDIX hydrolase [Anaerolineales bacterium HSG6]MDM8531368.1 NUDIX hydrolase [Anaerolineales bacterium HSG25]
MRQTNQAGSNKNNGKISQRRPYAARAFIVQDGHILFIHHMLKNPALNGKWTLPGGRLNPHENHALEALHREMQEELSLEIEVIDELGCFYSRSGLEYKIFVARKKGEIGPLNKNEVSEFAWLMPADVYEYHAKNKLQFGFEMDVVLEYLKRFGKSEYGLSR